MPRLVLIIIFFSCFYCRQTPHQDVIKSQKNKEIQVSLTTAMSQGYDWELVSISDSSKVIFVGQKEKKSSDKDGSSTKQIFTFLATEEGKYSILLKYGQPWKTDSAHTKYKTISLIIK